MSLSVNDLGPVLVLSELRAHFLQDIFCLSDSALLTVLHESLDAFFLILKELFLDSHLNVDPCLV